MPPHQGNELSVGDLIYAFALLAVIVLGKVHDYINQTTFLLTQQLNCHSYDTYKQHPEHLCLVLTCLTRYDI